MTGRQVLIYFAWSRPAETRAPLTLIEDRFPAIFELRRLFYPQYEQMAASGSVDQGVGGFLDHVQKPNFAAFAELAQAQTGRAAIQVEREDDDGVTWPLDEARIAGVDTIVVISFDSLSTGQVAGAAEIAAVRRFLDDPGHLIFVCPHHDIGEAQDEPADARIALQTAEHRHHGDRAIPPRQGFGGFARTLLAGLGAPVENRFGLRPAIRADGTAAPVEADRALDVLGLLEGVEAFNLHPHLPHLERVGDGRSRLDVLARQFIDPSAPPHPFTEGGRRTFDALLQSTPDAFAGKLLVSDTTFWSSTAGGVENLRRLWSNVLGRAPRSAGG